MSRAIELAKNGIGWVNPNPMVGAVIVKDNKIISEGYHHKFGEIHAEVDAINNANEDVVGSTIYVTLEPCCHHGKRPPCTDAIIKSGIKKVVIGSRDPNPLVSGKGVKILRDAGIEVIEDFLREKCDELNEVFFYHINNKRPYVVMKYGMTLDGKIATKTGESKWITSEESRLNVHKNRHKYMSIMVGINTVINDDPMLDCRIEGMKNPIRIICDTNLRIPIESKIVKTSKEVRTIIVTKTVDDEKVKVLEEKGCIILRQERNKTDTEYSIDLNLLMDKLYELGIDSVYLEGGANINWSALESGIVNEIHTYISPKLFGGKDSLSAIGGLGVEKIMDCKRVNFKDMRKLDEDILIVSEVKNIE